MATQTFHIHVLIMGKVEIGIYFCVTADILTSVLLKCFWSSPLSTIWILSKSLILTSGYGNRKAKFSKQKTTKHSKIFFLEAIWGLKLKLCINVYDIILYIKCVFIAVAHVFSLLWQLKSFHRFIMGKVKVGLCFYLTRYFDKSFTVMFLEHMNLVQTAEFD